MQGWCKVSTDNESNLLWFSLIALPKYKMLLNRIDALTEALTLTLIVILLNDEPERYA